MKIKHFADIDDNGNISFEDEKTYKRVINSLKGKRCYFIISEVTSIVSISQYNYYFGHIINDVCAKSKQFDGWNSSDIHNHLWKELRPGIKFSKNNSKKMKDYIDELIPYLSYHYKIYVQPDRKFSKVIS